MPTVVRLLKGLPLLLLSPILLAASLIWLLLIDAFFRLAGRKRKPADTAPRNTAANPPVRKNARTARIAAGSVVIVVCPTGSCR